MDLQTSDYERLSRKIGKDDTCRCREVDASENTVLIQIFRRLNLALKWMKEERTGGRKGKRDRTRRGEKVGEAQGYTNTKDKTEPIVTKFS